MMDVASDTSDGAIMIDIYDDDDRNDWMETQHIYI